MLGKPQGLSHAFVVPLELSLGLQAALDLALCHPLDSRSLDRPHVVSGYDHPAAAHRRIMVQNVSRQPGRYSSEIPSM